MSWLFAFFVICSQAGFLRIVGEPDLVLMPAGDGLKLVGEYQIHNQGDEPARDVFPEINLDQFRWQGEPKVLQAGEKAQWAIDQRIKGSDLLLPSHGEFPLSIFHSYADLNGYPFVIPSLKIITFGEKKNSVRPSMEMKIESKGSGQYSANLKIVNPTKEKKKFQPLYLLPREVELKSPIVPLEVAAGGELETSFLFQNKKGLVGSNYHAFAVMQWVEDGSRQALQASSLFKIEKQSKARLGWSAEFLFWGFFIWIFGAGLIAMWVFWIRPLAKLR